MGEGVLASLEAITKEESVGVLENKVVLVTGSSKGMGESHARGIVREGGSVVVADIDVAKGQALAEELGAAATFVRLNVAESADWERAIDRAEQHFGKLDALVNNAGILRTRDIKDTSDEDWAETLQVNLTGAFKGIRAVEPALRRSGGGSIINISSTAGVKGFAGSASYSASKWGVRGLTKCAALELAEFGIRVNSVHPGNVKTELIDGLYEGFPHVAMKRAADPNEITALVLYLASDASSFSTGSEFIADGGETAGLPALW